MSSIGENEDNNNIRDVLLVDSTNENNQKATRQYYLVENHEKEFSIS